MGRIGISSREGDCFYAVPFSKVEIYWLNRSKGRIIAAMDRVEENVKLLISVREASKMLTQEELAELANISVNHISALERGVKNAKLSTFVAIANALQVSSEALLIDVIPYSLNGVVSELLEDLEKLSSSEQKKILKAVKILIE